MIGSEQSLIPMTNFRKYASFTDAKWVESVLMEFMVSNWPRKEKIKTHWDSEEWSGLWEHRKNTDQTKIGKQAREGFLG